MSLRQAASTISVGAPRRHDVQSLGALSPCALNIAVETGAACGSLRLAPQANRNSDSNRKSNSQRPLRRLLNPLARIFSTGSFTSPAPPELLKKNVPHRTLRDVCSHNPGGNSGCGTGFPRDGKMLSRRIGTPDGTGLGEIGIPVTRWNGKCHSGQTE